MKYITLLFLICFTSLSRAQMVSDSIEKTQLTCLEVNEDNYILYRNYPGPDFSLYIKNDHCDLLELKTQKTQVNLTSNIYLEVNGKLLDLGLNETHNIMFPVSIHYEKYNPDVFIVEMDMVNFISTRGYTYLIIDLQDSKTLRYAEFTERLSLKKYEPVFKKFRQSKYETITINRP